MRVPRIPLLSSLAALGIAVVTVWVILWLHQLRPGENVLRLDAGQMSSAIPEAADGQPVELPHDWRHDRMAADVVWYRFNLKLQVAPNRLWAIYIPALEMTPAVLVNGALVGGDLDPAAPLPRYWNRPVMYSIPSGLLRPGQNYIDIRLAANGAWGRMAEAYMGPLDDLRPSYRQRYFWRVTFLNVTVIGSLLLAVFMAALSLIQRDSTYSWFSAFAFGWCLENTFILAVNVPVNNALWDLLAYLIVGVLLATGSMFTFRFLGVSRKRWEHLITATVCTGPLILLLLMLIDVESFNLAGSLLWIGVMLGLATYPAFLVMRTMMRRWDPEIFCLSICYLLSIMLGAHDWLVTSGLGFRHNGMLLQFAAVPTLATFGIMLLRRFIAALREKDALNRELEHRVASKAQQIEETFRRNRELESAQLLSQERERIMRDMHDGVGSQLIGMTGYLDQGNPRDALLSQELQTALRELRLMIDSLEDMEGDVVVALGLFRNRIQPQVDAAGLSMSWQVADLPRVPDLGPERVLQFMRILQEAVVNSIRHAGAKNLSVSTRVDGIVNGKPCISISVSDDGSGFEGLRNRGRGLDNMRHRAASAGLELEIHSDANGTTITIGFPDPEVETQ